MRRFIHFHLSTLLLMVLTAGVCLGLELRANSWLRHRAQIALLPSPSRQSETVNGLRITLEADKALLALEEKVHFTITIHNDTDQPIHIPKSTPARMADGEYIREIISFRNGAPCEVTPSSLVFNCPRREPPMEIPPRGRLSIETCGTFWPGLNTFYFLILGPRIHFRFEDRQAGSRTFCVRFSDERSDVEKLPPDPPELKQLIQALENRHAESTSKEIAFWSGSIRSNEIELELIDELTGFSPPRTFAYLLALFAIAFLNEYRIRRSGPPL
ncbi:MAG TPA: hypothetical protein VGP72_00230 [Planctomycetota bacterium]